MLKKICKAKLCHALCDYMIGYCEEHLYMVEQAERDRRAAVDKHRGSSTARGYDGKWRKIRARYLQVNQLCVECRKVGRYIPANEVHHIKALADGGTHDSDNLSSLCKSCHSSITAKDNGGYGKR